LNHSMKTKTLGNKEELVKHIIQTLQNGGSVFTQDCQGNIRTIKIKNDTKRD
jgi:hypothetical protein